MLLDTPFLFLRFDLQRLYIAYCVWCKLADDEVIALYILVEQLIVVVANGQKFYLLDNLGVETLLLQGGCDLLQVPTCLHAEAEFYGSVVDKVGFDTETLQSRKDDRELLLQHE